MIVLEGLDGSGKETQSKLLHKRLKKEGIKVHRVEFPDYSSESSSLIKMYLRGDFGEEVMGVDSYIASIFYTVDRYASYRTKWGKYYLDGGIILADRYMTSNMLYQSAKLDNKEDVGRYLRWLIDLEFNIFKIPKPDIVVYLDMPNVYSNKLVNKRGNIKDLHEKDNCYMERVYKTADRLTDKYNWERIRCLDGEEVRSIEDIHEEIYKKVRRIL